MRLRDSMTYEERIREIIRSYLQSNGLHLMTVERLYENLTNNEIEFSEWDEIEKEFVDLDWNKDLMSQFAELSKQIVEKGESRISETYFDIIEPDAITVEDLRNELGREPYDPDASGKEKEGFRFDVTENNHITGQYVYIEVDEQLTFDGEFRTPISEGFFDFEIVPEDSLLIVQSTKLEHVQKAKRYFGNKTNIEIVVSADYTTHYQDAVERVNRFLNSFGQGEQESSGDPMLLPIELITLHDPRDEVEAGNDTDNTGNPEIENIEFDGHDLANVPEVEEHLREGWIIKKLVAQVKYKDDIFKITIGVNSIMSYGKVSGSPDHAKSLELSEGVRERFKQHLRFRE